MENQTLLVINLFPWLISIKPDLIFLQIASAISFGSNSSIKYILIRSIILGIIPCRFSVNFPGKLSFCLSKKTLSVFIAYLREMQNLINQQDIKIRRKRREEKYKLLGNVIIKFHFLNQNVIRCPKNF